MIERYCMCVQMQPDKLISDSFVEVIMFSE